MTASIRDVFNQQADRVVRESRDSWRQSLVKWRDVLQGDARSAQAYLEIARCHVRLREHREALAVLREGVACCDPSPALLRGALQRGYINLLEECNLTGEAIAAAEQGIVLFPGDLWMKMQQALLLPVLYESTEEMQHYRRRFAQGLRRMCAETPLDSPAARAQALAAIAARVNLRLGYQAQNDRSLQAEYGEFARKIMAASYPGWTGERPMPAAGDGGELRVGYISSRFRNLSASKYFLGWLHEHTNKIAVHAYHVGRKTDSTTEEVRRLSRRFWHIPNSLEDTCQAIVADRLHILVYLDIGMEPMMTQLAALRLAPIQCMAWDHPITSGLPTIDYFLSGDLAEPEDAQDHYTEELIRLPGIGVSYVKPVIPAVLLNKSRRDFELRDDAVVYLCTQYAYKYLPDQDRLFAGIAARVPNAQFIFLADNEFVAADLRKRLELAFSAFRLRASDYCVLLPAIERFTYWNLNLLGDVFLDSLGWSGGVSTFEAVACGLPVVTMPGPFMRGRQSFAILTQLGVPDTIAHSEAEYVDIAVHLGLDRHWREDVVERMRQRHSSLYSDKRSAAALEDFYRRVVEEQLQRQQS